MSYYRTDSGYADYGNHSDDGYDKYEPYSDYTEPDHWEPEPTPSEPDYHNYAHVTDPTEQNHNTNCEYNANDANWGANKTHQLQQSKYEGEIEGHKLERGEDEIGEYEEERHKPEGLEYEGYEHREPMYEPWRPGTQNTTRRPAMRDTDPTGSNMTSIGVSIPPTPTSSPLHPPPARAMSPPRTKQVT